MKLQAISLSNASRRQTKHSQWSSVWSVALIISEIISGRERKGSKQITNEANNKQSLHSKHFYHDVCVLLGVYREPHPETFTKLETE